MKRIGALAAAAVVTVLGTSPVLQQNQDLDTRVAALEGRVAKLEALQAPAAAPMAETKAGATEFNVPVTIANKRFRGAGAESGSAHDSIWWDSRFDLSKLDKDARAIKGVLEFSDLFGESQVRVGFTINDPVKAASVHRSKGDGVSYDPARSGHSWLRTTDVKDIQVVFRVKQVIYADGKRAEFK